MYNILYVSDILRFVMHWNTFFSIFCKSNRCAIRTIKKFRLKYIYMLLNFVFLMIILPFKIKKSQWVIELSRPFHRWDISELPWTEKVFPAVLPSSCADRLLSNHLLCEIQILSPYQPTGCTSMVSPKFWFPGIDHFFLSKTTTVSVPLFRKICVFFCNSCYYWEPE